MNKAIFAVNSSIGQAGQGIAVHQALIEFKKKGLLEKVYCSGKGKYILEDLPLEILSLPNKLSFFLLRMPYLRNRKDIITLASDIIFDKLVSQRIDLGPSDFFIGTMGHCANTIKKLKNNSRKRIILYCLNSHINNMFDILEEEDRKFSRGIKTHSVHKKMVERVLEEYEYSDYIFVLSKYAYDTFIENGVKKDKLKIVWPGIDLSRFYPRNIKKDKIFRICYSGMLTLRKGFQYLLKALDELALPELELLIAGGSSDSVCHDMLEYYKKRIKIEQWKGGDHVEDYRRSDILVHPSLEDGWGLVVSEAVACGLPVVVTEHTGAKDIVEEGINGFIIPAADVEAIKEKILLLYDNRDLISKMSQAAVKKRDILDQDITAKNFFDECARLIE